MDDIGKTVLVVESENNQAYQLYVCISRSNGGGFDEQVEVKDNCVNYYPICMSPLEDQGLPSSSSFHLGSFVYLEDTCIDI